ncbi:Rha family transcriptional regulator [Metasolibacillus meyeri]|uniref:Rha family transcriptional regulator n=1 Tax=Metasolibacillus meyeri TaxID=1071052 RepID=UPI00398A98AA
MEQLVFIQNNEAVTDSLTIAQVFDKEHRNVTADIENQISKLNEANEREWGALNFQQTSYQHTQNKQWYQKYNLTADGFTIVAMAYTTPEAMKMKVKFLEEFKRMKEIVQNQLPQVQQVPTAPPDLMHANELLRCLREYSNVLNAESNRAIQSHAVELLTGKSPSQPPPKLVLEVQEWMTAAEIAQLANVPTQRIVWIARVQGISNDLTCCRIASPLEYNNKGRSRILANLIARTCLN